MFPERRENGRRVRVRSRLSTGRQGQFKRPFWSERQHDVERSGQPGPVHDWPIEKAAQCLDEWAQVDAASPDESVASSDTTTRGIRRLLLGGWSSATQHRATVFAIRLNQARAETPIRTIDRITIGTGRRGPITERLQKEFFAYIGGEIPDRHNWLTPVPALVTT